MHRRLAASGGGVVVEVLREQGVDLTAKTSTKRGNTTANLLEVLGVKVDRVGQINLMRSPSPRHVSLNTAGSTGVTLVS